LNYFTKLKPASLETFFDSLCNRVGLQVAGNFMIYFLTGGRALEQAEYLALGNMLAWLSMTFPRRVDLFRHVGNYLAGYPAFSSNTFTQVQVTKDGNSVHSSGTI
jgi:hypothetical protein